MKPRLCPNLLKGEIVKNRYKDLMWIVLLGATYVGSVFFFQGCAATSYKGMSPEKSNLVNFYSIYNSQFADYQWQTIDPSILSEAKKQTLRKKRDMLIEFHRLIKLYEIAINMDSPASSMELRRKIFELIDKLE